MARIIFLLPTLISIVLLIVGRSRPGLTQQGRFGAWLWLFCAVLLTRFGRLPILMLIGLLAQVALAVYLAVKLRFLR